MCKLIGLFFLFIFLFSVSANDHKSATNVNDIHAPHRVEFKTNSPTSLKDFEEENLNSSASESCNETQPCQNGGACLQHACVCLPGTSGPFCKTVDDCKNRRMCGNDDSIFCEYSVEKQRAECLCHTIEYRYDEVSRACKSCICSPGWSSNFDYFSHCEYKGGNKMCTCRKGYSYDPKREYCDDCRMGKYSKWCKFNRNGEKEYACEEGYSYYKGSLECLECKCGQHGKCDYKSDWTKVRYCVCDPGYVELNKTCVECKCGKYGDCIFDEVGNQTGCICKEGYAEKLGTCEMCYCGDEANCSFTGNSKVCDCPEGYQDLNGFCEDIDECEKLNPCKSSSICINTPGSHKCLCAEGYEIKTIKLEDGTDKKTCADIDECENPNTCAMPNSECLNTVGSFACVCKPGFVSRGGIGSNSFCEKTEDASLYTVASVTIFTVLLILLGFYIFTKRSSRTAGSSTHELLHH